MAGFGGVLRVEVDLDPIASLARAGIFGVDAASLRATIHVWS